MQGVDEFRHGDGCLDASDGCDGLDMAFEIVVELLDVGQVVMETGHGWHVQQTVDESAADGLLEIIGRSHDRLTDTGEVRQTACCVAAGASEEMVVGGNVGGAVSMTAEVAEGHVWHSPLGRAIHAAPVKGSEILYGECGHESVRRMSLRPKSVSYHLFVVVYVGVGCLLTRTCWCA